MKKQFENQTKKKFSLNKQVISEVEALQINGGASAGICLVTRNGTCGNTLACPLEPRSNPTDTCGSQSTLCAICS